MHVSQLNHKTRTFEELLHLYDQEFDRLRFEGNHRSAFEATYYFFRKKGKRLRPVLCLMSYEMMGGDAADVLPTSIALELFHSFTLIHDDILDNAATRRGQESVFHRYGLGNTIVTGDSVMIAAYQQLNKQMHKSLGCLLAQFNETSVHVLEGQQLDIELEDKTGVTTEDYLTMIEYKTAALFGCCLKMGGILAGSEMKDQTRLYQAGKNLGMAFQIMDDYLDAFGSEKHFGKKIGGDILQNKNTILAVTAWEKADARTKKDLLRLREEQDPSRKVQETLTIFHDLEVGETAKALMNEYYDKSRDNLGKISKPSGAGAELERCFEKILRRIS